MQPSRQGLFAFLAVISIVYLPFVEGPRSCDCQTRCGSSGLSGLGFDATEPGVGPGSVWIVARVVSHGQLM